MQVSEKVLFTVCLLLVHTAHLFPLYMTNKNVKLKLGFCQKMMLIKHLPYTPTVVTYK